MERSTKLSWGRCFFPIKKGRKCLLPPALCVPSPFSSPTKIASQALEPGQVELIATLPTPHVPSKEIDQAKVMTKGKETAKDTIPNKEPAKEPAKDSSKGKRGILGLGTSIGYTSLYPQGRPKEQGCGLRNGI